MGRKNRNKNKKEKKSDGSTGNVNGNNDRWARRWGVGATTIVLTEEQIKRIDIECGLKGYPRSNDFLVGQRAWALDQVDRAIDAFKRGADNVGCVPCMYFYVIIQFQRDNLHLIVPVALEAAVRGHMTSMDLLIGCYKMAKPVNAIALVISRKLVRISV